ncbi:hypothetical protein BDV18DRAFT_139316 [Aspergillus unguis]
MDKSEILVHISAPSGAADDARYRSQVEAILNFQTHSREIISVKRDNPASSSPTQNLGGTETAEYLSPRPALPAPRVPKRDTSQKDSLETPVSVIPDSQPEQSGPALDAEGLSLIPEERGLSSHQLFKRPRLEDPSQHDDAQGDTAEDLTRPTINPPSNPSKEPGELEEQQKSPGPEPEAQQRDPIPISLPLEIKPPSPPISTSLFTTHITPTLEMLSKRLKSPRTYNPTIHTRDLDTLERGYWHLHLHINLLSPSPEEKDKAAITHLQPARNTIWDKPLFTRFWTFLSDFISKEGRAGWGVWCILEETNPSTDDETTPQGPAQATSNVQSLDLKVYTWGEVASHIYLLLFLASERRVRTMGAQWRDASDEVVIQMPGPS